MKWVFILLLVLIPPLASCTGVQQKEMTENDPPSSFQPKPLDDAWYQWLVGTWQVAGAYSDFIGGELEILDESDEQGGFVIEFDLNGQFLIYKSWARTDGITDEQTPLTDEQMQHLKESTHASDEEIEKFLSLPFKELQIHTIDPKTGERVGYLFDSLRCIAKGSGRLEGNKETMEWEWSGTGQGAASVSILEKIDDNKFSAYHKYILPSGKKMEEKVIMIRKTTTIPESDGSLN